MTDDDKVVERRRERRRRNPTRSTAFTRDTIRRFRIADERKAGQAAQSTVAMFGRVDRVLTGATSQRLNSSAFDKDQSQHFADVLSYTDGTTLNFNTKLWTDYFAAGEPDSMIAGIFGLNYHELAHWLLTPHTGSKFFGALSHEQRYNGQLTPQVYNILEDQRIETLLGAQYPRFRHYWRMSCRHYLFEIMRGAVFDTYWLIAGRHYLPNYLRKASRRAFVVHYDEHTAAQVDEIVSQYRLLNLDDPASYRPAIELIYRFQNLYAKSDPSRQARQKHENVCQTTRHKSTDGQRIKVGANMSRQAAKQAAKEAAEAEAEGDGEGQDGDGERQTDRARKSHMRGSKKEVKKGKQGGDGFSESGSFAQQTADEFTESMNRANREMVGDLMRDTLTMTDIKTVRRAISQGATEPRLHQLSASDYRDLQPTAEMRQKRRDFEQRVQVFIDQADPGWETHQTYGKLSVARVIRGDDPHYVFDSWREDRNDALSIEARFHLDMSSSMQQGRIEQVSKALWILRGGLQAVDCRSYVSGFNNQCFELRSADDLEQSDRFRLYAATGGTDPTEGLLNAKIGLSNSERRHKLNIVLTDGAWGGSKESNQHIKDMNDTGVTTIGFHIGGFGYSSSGTHEEFRHGQKLFFNITDGMEMHNIADTIITDLLRSAL